MARTDEVAADIHAVPTQPDKVGWRHWGDGLAGRYIAARLQGFYPTAADYRDVQVDANGVVQTAGGGAGGGAATIADGADVAQGTTTDLSSANTVVGILKAIKAAITSTVAVSGTFFQATQPVSLATAPTTPVTGTFWQATQPVSGTFWQATQPVSLASAPTTPVTGTFFQATQPVSAASLPLPTGASTSANQSAVKAASTLAAATDTSQVVQHSPMRSDAANLCVTNTAATGVACTLTIPAAAAGLFHYISLIEIQLYATVARTGGATPVLVTTTNLPGSPVWDFDTAQAIGVTIRQATQPATPIKSSVAATATTIVAPIATTGIWRITAYYYTAP